LIERCRPHAASLGCLSELDGLGPLASANGADRQREVASGAGLEALVTLLAKRFSSDWRS
jgi:hypothetical protein